MNDRSLSLTVLEVKKFKVEMRIESLSDSRMVSSFVNCLGLGWGWEMEYGMSVCVFLVSLWDDESVLKLGCDDINYVL